MISKQKVGRISPLNAIVFACIFQDAEKAGKAMLDFLNAVLKYVGEEPIVEILDMKSEYAVFGEIANQKYGRLDVRVKAESGRIFDVEVQIDKDYMNERGFFYGIRIGEEEFKSGSSYIHMPEVRVINLVDFYVRDDKTHVVEPVVVSYANNPGELATEKFKMYHIQLPAFRKEHKTLESVKNDTFLAWLYMFDRGYQNPDEMEVLSDMTEGLRNFATRYNYAISDPDLIRRYRMYEDGKHDIATRIEVAERKAAEKATKEAEEKAEKAAKEAAEKAAKEAEKNNNIKVAKDLKQHGVDPAIISSATGLSLDEIARL